MCARVNKLGCTALQHTVPHCNTLRAGDDKLGYNLCFIKEGTSWTQIRGRFQTNPLNTNPWASSNEHKIPWTDYCVQTKRNTLKGLFFNKESCFREENSFERIFPIILWTREVVLLIACIQDETPREIQRVLEQMRLGMVIRSCKSESWMVSFQRAYFKKKVSL